MMKSFRITIVTLTILFAGMMVSDQAEALLAKHDCNFCHSLHGGTSSLVPLNSPTNIEVLCMSCHLTANGATDAVQPHRDDGGYAAFHQTCTQCHEVHDNMPNWRSGDPSHIDSGTSGTEGINVKMIGREDPDGDTPYAIILTNEKDFNKNGIPDRGTVTQTCNENIVNDCYTMGRRYIIFEQAIPTVSIHGWADNDEDGKDPITEDPADPIAIQTNQSDSGALSGGKNWSAYDSLCQMCHTQTSKHNLLTSAQLTHNDDRACTDCHTHAGCFDKGDACSKWSVPNRDLQVDAVTASPSSVNAGQLVTITVNVSNLGADTETIQVKYTSDIEGALGFSTVTDVAPGGGTAQTFLDWLTSDGGTHIVTADIIPVIGEVATGNNSGTDTITVLGADQHDVAVTSVSSPSPIQQGNTETVSVGLENLGDFSEGPFDVTLTSDLDGLIGTASSGLLAIGATPTLNFSWDTTGATLGTHLLTATFATFTDDVPGNDSGNTTAVVAIHDVAVTSVTAPPSTDQGTTASVSVDIANLSVSGGFTETFNVTLSSDLDGQIQVLSSGAVSPGATPTLNFSWDTTGATIATHTLTATADTVTDETITANNTSTTTAEVIAPVTHDVTVTSVTAPAVVDRGTSPTVTVRVTNNGGATETFNVTLSSDLDGQIQVLSSGALVAGNFTDLNFTWTTVPATSLGLHTLTAVADTVPGETNTGDNTNSTTSTVTSHDVAVTSVTDTPDPVNQGGTVTVDVTVTNQGSFAETFNVTLTSDQDGVIHTWTNVNLSAGATTTPALTFNWDTTTATVATHTLTATAGPVTGELDTSDNSVATSNTVNPSLVHDVAVDTVTAPASTPQGGTAAVDVDVSNPGDFTETFNVTLYDNTDDPGHASPIQTLSSGSLAPSGSTTLNFSWDTTGASIAIHTLEAVATHDGGDGGTDSNAGNNSATTTSDVTAGTVNDLAITAMFSSPAGPTITTCGSKLDIIITLTVKNEGTVTEGPFNVTLASTLGDGPFPSSQVTSLAAGASTNVDWTWKFQKGTTCGARTFTGTVDTVAGETDTADNTATLPITIN